MTEPKISVLQVCSAREAIYGAAKILLALAGAQRDAGLDVSFLAFAGMPFGDHVRKEGFPTTEVRVRSKVDFIAIAQIVRDIKRRNISLVHTHLSTSSVNGGLAARLAGVPSVATVHGMSGRLSYFAADHLIAVSNGVKGHLMMQGVKDARISVVHNGVSQSTSGPTREQARQSLGLPFDVPVIGTVSRITRLKGIDDGLRAIARLRKEFPDVQYLVVGDGDGLPESKRVAQELGISDSVKFVGYREDVPTYLAAMDLFLFPSLKEGMGVALVEAMFCGLPIVTTNVDGIPEVITPETGILVGARQPDALALAAREILVQPSRALELGESARRRADRLFSVRAMEQATDAVYRSLLNLPPRQQPATQSGASILAAPNERA